MCLIPLSLPRSVESGYEFASNGQNINYLRLEIVCRDEKALESLIQPVRVVSEEIGMELGINKSIKRVKIE